MPAPSSFDYAVFRIVPRVEREEFINAGVILFCRTRRFLAARVALDPQRLAALGSLVDPEEVERHLALIPLICAGESAAGPIASLTQTERFYWLTAPRSTIVQPSAVHSGISDDPAANLERLIQAMVRPPPADTA